MTLFTTIEKIREPKSCWKCKKSFTKGYEYCLKCDANIHAYCYICIKPIYAIKTDNINMLYQDNLKIPIGRPICEECYELLKNKIPKHLNYLKRYFEKKAYFTLHKKKGLEKWIKRD